MNEILLLLTGLFSTLFVYIAWKTGAERLYTTIVVFLILITTVGGKIVEFFGHETNTGNIYYASIFLATYFLIERFGRREGMRSIWIGAATTVFFSILVQIAILYDGMESTNSLNDALGIVFDSSLRIPLASLIAFMASQAFNIHVYLYLKKRFNAKHLWLRANATNAVAQILDSAVFFSIAFYGLIAPTNLWDIIFTGIAIKVIYMMAASPLLYLNHVEQEEGKDYSTITVR